ncbi:MAG: DNA repair protein RadA [Ignavibacteria bacterium RBG_13_36_8]|nr:MAG: DNA repair protein RadA [Ignavibacteria bacterium RBG_13_36_8]
MGKQHIKYVCTNCGYQSLQWLGKCPTCGEWNTMSEEIVERKTSMAKIILEKVEAQKLTIAVEEEENRIKTGMAEFDRVLGGGLMPGSVVLIGGDPGIGKSTLVMQAGSKVTGKTLYVSGEESLNQMKLRSKRLNVKLEDFFVLMETNLDLVIAVIEKSSPDVVIIDSIQTMYKPDLENTPGTVTQIRECTVQLMQIAKKNNCVMLLVGHVTKEGFIAGPKVLEHIVDTVLQFEGEKNHSYRILRAQKNRFGSTNELGIFEMHENGLIEVENPSKIFLSERGKNITGSVVTASIEGTRPILIEVQALVTPSNYGNPQRVATGFDYRRLSILLAVLEKRAALRLSAQNVFLNMAGGIKIEEPAVDLAVCTAIASSLLNKPAKNDIVVVGEVGLGGEVRSVGHIDKRIQEAAKLGFKHILIPSNNSKPVNSKKTINVIPVEDLSSAIAQLLVQ